MKALYLISLIILITAFSLAGGKTFRTLAKNYHVQPVQRNEHKIIGAQAPAGWPEIDTHAHNPDILQYFRNAKGQSQIDMGIFRNHAVQDMYGPDGSMRLQLGVYNDEVRANEEGLPLAGLFDSKGRLRLLYRLDGSDQSALILMKDTSGINRLIMGLDINGGEGEPFLVTFDKDSQKKVPFGKTSSPGNPNF
jgi:hypothetical protein